jgi:OOP family OmpA-OmpF porin
MTRTIRALLISFVALCGSQAMAVEFPNGFYGGIGGGVSVDKDFCTQTGSSKSCEERAFTWKILGGYQFMKWVALEGTLTDLNGPDTKTDLLVSVGDDVRKSTQGVTASAVFTAPVLEAMGFYGKLGGVWWDQEVKVSVAGQPTVQNDDNGVSWLWGVGFRYPFTDTFGIFIEYELYMDIGATQTYGTAPNSMTLTGTDIDVYTASLVWRF